jgi:hypothetical protein
MKQITNSETVNQIIADHFNMDLSECHACGGTCEIPEPDNPQDLNPCSCSGETVAEFRECKRGVHWGQDKHGHQIWLDGQMITDLLDRAFSEGFNSAIKDLQDAQLKRSLEG